MGLGSCFSASGRHQVCSGEGVPFFSHVLIISPLSILPHKESTVSFQLGRSIIYIFSSTVSEPGVNPRYILYRPCKAGLIPGWGCLLHGNLSGLQLLELVLESCLPNLSESFSGSQLLESNNPLGNMAWRAGCVQGLFLTSPSVHGPHHPLLVGSPLCSHRKELILPPLLLSSFPSGHWASRILPSPGL